MASTSNHRTRGSDDFGVFDDAKTYYASEERHTNRFGARTRTFSQVSNTKYEHDQAVQRLTDCAEQHPEAI